MTHSKIYDNCRQPAIQLWQYWDAKFWRLYYAHKDTDGDDRIDAELTKCNILSALFKSISTKEVSNDV